MREFYLAFTFVSLFWGWEYSSQTQARIAR